MSVPMVRSQSEAKRFFVEKVIAQARVEQVALSDAERGMLMWSESDPDFIPDQGLAEQLAAEMPDDEYQRKVTGLLARAFAADFAAKREAAEQWIQALAVLRQGDHYILVMLEQAVGRSLKR